MYQKKNFFNAANALSGIIKQTPLLWSKKLNDKLGSNLYLKAECLQLTGKFDYQLRIITKDIPSFEKLLENKLGNIEEIAQLETSVVISTKKNSSVAPLDYKKEIILKR